MATLKLKESFRVNRDTIRDVYTYKGIQIYHNVIMPLSIFKKQSQLAVVDYIVEESENTVEWYTPEGYGLPIFHGLEICLDKAKEFIDKLK